MDLSTIDLAKLNSATQYPSIPTYHELDPKNGNLLEKSVLFPGEVILTEKVDGTNGRIIRFPDGDYLIGSREHLLHAKGDRILNTTQSIVEALLPVAEKLEGGGTDHIETWYLEVYGHKVGAAAKQYTGRGNVGYRAFDISFVSLATLVAPVERIASWRDGGGQRFATEATLQRAAEAVDVPLTPRLGTREGTEMPTTVLATNDWLKLHVRATQVALDDGAGGKPEGLVIRTPDRRFIAKARFQDYERTLKRRAAKK